ncbi:MAG TPA: hypothetical protein VI589_05185, partial [Vicinamibacteria bacterium]
YAILANEWIAALATAGAATLPPVDLAPFIGLADAAGTTGIGASSTGRPRGPRAEFTAEAYEQLLRLFPALDVGN